MRIVEKTRRAIVITFYANILNRLDYAEAE